MGLKFNMSKALYVLYLAEEAASSKIVLLCYGTQLPISALQVENFKLSLFARMSKTPTLQMGENSRHSNFILTSPFFLIKRRLLTFRFSFAYFNSWF